MAEINRREYFKMMGVGAAALGMAGMNFACKSASEHPKTGSNPSETEEFNTPPNREQRMAWWHQARFGMFIHFGLYSVLGRHEWAMEEEGIPVVEYMKLDQQFKPKPGFAKAWASLAKQAGMKYMVMTTKHHEGFCNFATDLTPYCAPKQGPGRDLVKEYVEAARSEGMRVGFYYSLMDWHHPDGARCAHDEAARRRFVDYTHGLIRDLMSHYGKIDILWYDVAWPLDAKGWESEKMNAMVFQLQPDIIVNNRNKLEGDFTTPEQTITAASRPWESCMTMNDSWGFNKSDDNWKTPKTVVRNLITCSHDTGNYLLNIVPKADGSIPEESVRIMTTVGKWMEKNGKSIYQTEKCQPRRSNYASFTRNGNTLYMHNYFWPGETATIGGMMTKVKSARLLSTGKEVKFEQDKFRVRFIGLPETAPDDPVTTIAIECDGEPRQDTDFVRKERPRTS